MQRILNERSASACLQDSADARTQANRPCAENLLIGVLENQKVDSNFSKKVIFSDEAHFQLDGYLNTQNCRIWGAENPRVIHENPLHGHRATVWCGFWAGGVIGAYFFENEAGNVVTANGTRYHNMITEFLRPQLDGMDMEDMRFQQDGATCHTARETTRLLREKFFWPCHLT